MKEGSPIPGKGCAPGKAGVRTDQGYGSIVGRQFFSKRLALLGLVLAGFFFFLAVFAPFLAGNRPLVFKTAGTGLCSPVLEAFTAEDFLWLAGAGSVFAAWLFGAVWKRRVTRKGRSSGPDRDAGMDNDAGSDKDVRPVKDAGPDRDAGLWRAAAPGRARAVCGLVLLSVTAVVGALWPERLDRSDYRAYRDGAKTADLCILPPVPYSPTEFDFSQRLQGPGGAHLLGTDQDGRDMLSRLIHGARISILVGFVAVSIYVLIGIVVGALAGYFGGITDLLLSRLIEVVICFPVFFAILAVLCFLPPSILWVMVLIGILRWPGVARLTRGEFLRLKSEQYVTAGRALGLSHFRIIFLHMLPNGMAPVLVSATFGIAGAILLESGLSFLGFGVQPPTPSWGQMLAGGKDLFDQSWGLVMFPGLAIFLAVTAFNLVGEGLRDALDPRLKR